MIYLSFTFQRYFNCIDSQIQNFIKVQLGPLKKFKIQKKIVFVIFLDALHDWKKKNRIFDQHSNFAFHASYNMVSSFKKVIVGI